MRTITRCVLVAALVTAFPGHAAPQNQLQDSPSPYLAMHGHDPVHWQLWGRAALEQARREDKLLYLSIGYFACRWCHVMHKESFQNNEIAALLNANFVSVAVDRELNPALDARMSEFAQRTLGYSGWPLNVFVTPEGYPLLAFVYLPPDKFKSLLTNLRGRWRVDRAALKAMAANAAGTMHDTEPSAGPDLAPGLGREYRAALVAQALQQGDDMAGGFGGPNKFPSVPQMLALVEAYHRQPDPKLGGFLRLTLDRMASQGLYDHVRGGFFRYVTDPDWQTPHFEKMLYDNALLAQLYLKAAKVFNHPAYGRMARETLNFMLREFMSDRGAMIASLSAVDDKGVEGGFYLWSDGDLRRLLTADELAAVRLAWNMGAAAPLPGGHLPVIAMTVEQVASQLKLPAAKVSALLASAREKLRTEQRKHRSLPRDGKLLAGWNGLALRTFSIASDLDGGQAYRAAAKKIRNYIVRELWDGDHLLRARSAKAQLGNASLQDYAYVASGLYAWAQRSGSKDDYALVRRIVEQGWKRYYGPGGWVLAQDMLLRYGTAEAVIADGPMPSPAAVLIEVSLRLARHDHDEQLRKRALTALNAGHKTLESDPFWFATQINTIAELQGGRAQAARP